MCEISYLLTPNNISIVGVVLTAIATIAASIAAIAAWCSAKAAKETA